MATKRSVTLVLGDSFVNRLDKYIEQHQALSNMGLSLPTRDIVFHGQPGLLVDNLYHHLHVVRHLTPDIVLIHVGSNDLDNGTISSGSLVQSLKRFAQHIKSVFGVRMVIILEVFFRARVCRGPWSSVSFLNNTIKQFNAQCKSLARTTTCPFLFWHHPGMVLAWEQYISQDGVHLNKQGLTKYYKSVRSAVIKYSSLLKRLPISDP